MESYCFGPFMGLPVRVVELDWHFSAERGAWV
jgi:hypothetical protein